MNTAFDSTKLLHSSHFHTTSTSSYVGMSEEIPPPYSQMSSSTEDGLIEDLRRVVLDTRATTLALERQCEGAREALRQAEENLKAAEKELEDIRRMKKFVEDLENECFVCTEKFSQTAGKSTFNVVSFACNCAGNARMVHLHCWCSFPTGQERCGLCSSPVHLVDEGGQRVQVTLRRTGRNA